MKRILIPLLALLGSAAAMSSFAADVVQEMPEIPEPPVLGEKGIWGSIAYSETNGKYGFFWGADKRDEAEKIALKHCENQKNDGGCAVITTFRNHRHWSDDDKTGFPYNHCAALALGAEQDAPFTRWGTSSAETRKDAEQSALEQCEAKGGECKIKEWVCT